MATRKCSNTITIDIVHRISMHVYSGAVTGFSKRGGEGVGTRDTKSGVGGGGCPLQARDEGGVLSALGPTRKAGWGGRGGAVRFRPDTKSGVCVCVWVGGDAVYLMPAIRNAEVGGGGGYLI